MGFKTLKTAYATIVGTEVQRTLRRGKAPNFILDLPRADASGEQIFNILEYFNNIQALFTTPWQHCNLSLCFFLRKNGFILSDYSLPIECI